LSNLTKTVFIIGAGCQIGKQLSADLLKKKYQVICVGRKKTAESESISYVETNLSEEIYNFEKNFSLVSKDTTEINLIYLASYQIGRKSFISCSTAEIQKMVSINITNCLLTVHSFFNTFNKRVNSCVVFGSEAAIYGGNRIASYATVKAALHCFVKAFSREIASDNQRINIVSPSIMDSEHLLNLSEAEKENLFSSLPIGRPARLEEVSKVVQFLLSDDSSYVSGITLSVNGAR
jgi:NAD(P)-dependent dehydrogenase (short-subunit alcohol dehydrogenase family)